MKELELCHPSNDQKHSWRLFNKKNHRCNNRTATFDELRNAFKTWNPDNSPDDGRFINTDDEIWLKRSLTDKETIDDKTIICLYEHGYSTSTWYKIAIHDNIKDTYLLRSFTNSVDPYKDLPLAQDTSYKVDLSTLGAGEPFWIRLRDSLFGTIHKMEYDYLLC